LPAAGPSAGEMVRRRGGEVFLDLKFHDIPATVAAAVRAAARLGVGLLTVHASGGSTMLEAAMAAARTAGGARPRIVAVTVLTSLDRAALQRELGVPVAVEGHALHLADLARAAGRRGRGAGPPGAARPPGVPGPAS